ncbi:hypothetical protein ACTOVP_06710 [Arcanobacterium canis]
MSDDGELTSQGNSLRARLNLEPTRAGEIYSKMFTGSKGTGTVVTSDQKRTLTIHFDRPVLNPIYKLNVGPGSKAASGDKHPENWPALWQTYTWEDVRISAIDGKEVAKDNAQAARVVPKWIDSPYANFYKSGLTPGDYQLDDKRFFVPDKGPNGTYADGFLKGGQNYGFGGQANGEIRGWVQDITVELTLRGIVADPSETAVRSGSTPSGTWFGVGVSPADLSVEKTVTPVNVIEGDTVTWNVSVKSLKDSPHVTTNGSYGYYLVDEFPAGVDAATVKVVKKPADVEEALRDGNSIYFKKILKDGYELQLSQDHSTVTVVKGNREVTPKPVMPKGSTDTFTFTAKVAKSGKNTPYDLTNNVKILTTQYDTNPANNSSSAVAHVVFITPVNADTVGVQGQSQTSADKDKGDHGKTPQEMFPNAPTGSTIVLKGADKDGAVKVPGQGTYTVDKTGVVTFTPEPLFAGTATPVTVELTTPGGNTVSATYTPTVTEKPSKPGKPVDPKPGKPVDPKPGKPSKPAPQTPEANKSHKGSLPMTGSSALTALGVALVLAVGGSTTVVAVRRRNKA